MLWLFGMWYIIVPEIARTKVLLLYIDIFSSWSWLMIYYHHNLMIRFFSLLSFSFIVSAS